MATACMAILHNQQQVWQHELEGKDGAGVDRICGSTSKNDTLRFLVDKRAGSPATRPTGTHGSPMPTGGSSGIRAFAANRQGAAAGP